MAHLRKQLNQAREEDNYDEYDDNLYSDEYDDNDDELESFEEDEIYTEDDLEGEEGFNKSSPPNKRKVILMGVIGFVIVCGAFAGVKAIMNKHADKPEQPKSSVQEKVEEKKDEDEPKQVPGVEKGYEEPESQEVIANDNPNNQDFNPDKAKAIKNKDYDPNIKSDLSTGKTGKDSKESQYSEKIEPGMPNLDLDTEKKNYTAPSDPKDFVKDVLGNRIPSDYDEARREIKTDFVSYTKRRGITGDGTELYWLDAVWKERPYPIQVGYGIFKELDTKGITVVDMEVVTTTEGNKVITCMDVNKDAKAILERERRNK